MCTSFQVLLALAVFLQFLSNTLPRNCDTTPILSVFFIASMTVCAMALITTILVLAVYHRGEDKPASSPPYWITEFFLQLKRNSRRSRRLGSHVRLHQHVARSFFRGLGGKLGDRKNELCFTNGGNIIDQIEKNLKNRSSDKQDDGLASALQDIQREVNKITVAIVNQEKQDRITQEWKRLAKDLDWLFFTIFMVVFTLSGTCTLIQAYYAYNDQNAHK